MESLGQKLSVVHHVVVAQQYAFGQAGRAAGVLDVGYIVDVHVVRQPALGVEQRRPIGRVEVDGVLQRERLPMPRTTQDLLIIGALIRVPQKHGLHL